MKKINHALLIGLMTLSLAACANNQTAPVTESLAEETAVVEEATENPEVETAEVATESDQAEETNDKNNTNAMADGTYSTSLSTANNGARDSEFSFPTLSGLNIEDNKLTVDGSFDHRKDPENYDFYEELDNETRTFLIDQNTEFSAGGGLAEPTYYTADEFKAFYEEVKDSGLGLVITVKNGVASHVLITS